MSSTNNKQQHTTPSNGQHPIAQHLATLQAKKQQSVVASATSVSQPKQRKTLFGWTGFQGKTLWDWLQLLAALAIPVAVAIGTIWFSYQQNMTSLQLSDKQHTSDQQIAQKNRQNDLQISQDQQQETTLQTYLDRMQDLLLNYHLRQSKQGDEVREVARTLTLTALQRLDSSRKGTLLKFVYEAELINVNDTIVSLVNADLTGAELNSVNLSNANLSGAYLSGTDLSFANLNGAKLINAYCIGTFLDGTKLHHANISNATLYGALLDNADLSGANLSGAILAGANMNGTNITNEQLNQAKSLAGATMPDGSKHP